MEKQPAEKSYVFDQAYKDVGSAFATTWGQTFDGISIKKLFSSVLLFLPNLVAFLGITIFRVALNSVISLLLILVFLTVASVVYISFAIVAFLDMVYRGIRRISSVCPNCQRRFDLPTYLCPSCGRKHSRLIPSRYGIFKRKCLCGAKLPTTFFNGRQKLQAVCRECEFDLRDGGNHVEICIPVVGGTDAGKTCFITAAISQMEKVVAGKSKYDFAYASNELKNNIQKLKDNIQEEHPLEKTGKTKLQYYQFYFTPKKEKVKRLFSICDITGETYNKEREIGDQIGFKYADAFIIVVDPLSIDNYRAEVEQTIDFEKNGASSAKIDEILGCFVLAVGRLCGKSSVDMLKTDVAIVFTKCDLPGLDEQIGTKAVHDYMQIHHTTKEEASNSLCEAFLRKYQEDNFVNNVKSKFKTVQYFTCSSLGDRSSGIFCPEGVEEPVLWIIKKYI